MPQFRLLGPLEMTVGDRVVNLGPVKRRTVLAALLVDVGRPVRVETLVDRVWDDEPPAKARDVLYAHIARIRSALVGSNVVVERRSGGYALHVDPDQVDAHLFRRLVAEARAEDCPDERRATLLRAALDLWQAAPLADVPGSWAAGVRENLEQQRRSAVALWARTLSDLGRPAAVVDTLRELVTAEPLAEPLLVELVRALHRAGRAAEALDTYARARARIVDALGVEPGPELRAMYEAALHADERTEQPASTPTVTAGESGPVPAQLPADVPAFTGREPALTELTERLTGPRPAGAVVVSAVDGTAGVGKTALAVRWSHQVRDRFPDGQLYVDLRGYGTEPPVPPAAALAGFLTALGVAARDVPLDIDERAARYRTELSGRRLLLVLDNASSVEQVRPLLPGSPTCATLVTSRDVLSGLVAVDGAHRMFLDLLEPAEAIALLRSLVGRRVDDDPDAAGELGEQCGRLPLALRIAAELANARPQSPLADLVTELADHRARLELLDVGGDPRADVRAVFSWSYRRLPDRVARMFRLLGAHPGAEFDAYAAAALADVDVSDAVGALDALARAHLVRPVAAGAYDLHDLLRAYARSESDPGDDTEAGTRLFDYYLAASAAAMDVLYPAERHRRPVPPAIRTPLPVLPSAEDARVWLDRHRAVLIEVAQHTAAHGRSDVTGALASTLYVYLDNGGYSADALTVHSCALDAASRAGDRAGVAAALSHLGVVYWQMGRYPDGTDHLERALVVFRELGDAVGEARTVGNLGVICQQTSRYVEAEEHHTAALALFRKIGDRVGQANTETNLGDILMRFGRNEEAIDLLADALEQFRGLGHDGGEATALTNLGEVHLSLGRPEEAAGYLRQAVRLFASIGERYGETCALNGLAEAELGRGSASAADRFAEALALATTIGERAEQARAHLGLAQATDRAREHLEQALALYTDLGSPAADDVRKRLENLGT
ncbi:AfsR/SARP family transcriptional regulator [Cryptosporangium arvum]|uniref:DNA-binding transcriptional activator of the SARP family n=1 Tax=Cryptosporangium arvum DSM 44712 TaxID=927661 RepID=A0A010ZRI1_9ACTN|nr:AfsR/SARP family transcriptional regulator [Cryptosporangium arvum]EXG79797.1 DNA-binding transcriptional activator of the SARP family [Cryptosporangium arvum DSM 44712]